MQNSISHWQRMLLQEVEEKQLSPKQQKIAKLDPPADEIDAGDFKALRAGAKIDEEITSTGTIGRDGKDLIYIDLGDERLEYEPTPEEYQAFVSSGGNAQKMMAKSWLSKAVPHEPSANALGSLGMGKGHHIDEDGADHEVSMANNSIETIIKHAMELKAKLGEEEKDIPAWIQDHITNAANFISQAAENYHEYGDQESQEPEIETGEEEMSLQKMMEKMMKGGHK
jgi:hypothetical protein